MTVPTKVYKFIPLETDPDLDTKRFITLGNNQLWFSTYYQLNDPYESRPTYYNIDEVSKSTGLTNGIIERRLKMVLSFWFDRHKICSFSLNNQNNPAMWAYYANNGRGFCVEYEVDQHIILQNDYYTYGFVNYVTQKDDYTELAKTIVGPLHNEMMQTGDIKDTHALQECLAEYIMNNVFSKSVFWKDEREWRVCHIDVACPDYPTGKEEKINANILDIVQGIVNLQNGGGGLVKLSDFGLSVSSIYVGFNCSSQNTKMLKIISEAIGCKRLFKLYAGKSSHSFNFDLINL